MTSRSRRASTTMSHLSRQQAGWAVLSVGVVAGAAWIAFSPMRSTLPREGPRRQVGASSPTGAASQFFRVPPLTAERIGVSLTATAATRLVWELQTTEPYDTDRQFRPYASGRVAVGASAAPQSVWLPIAPLDLGGRELLLVAWFDGPGAEAARLEASGLNAYPGQLSIGGRSEFGDLELAVEGRSLYSEVRARIAGWPAVARSPLLVLAGLGLWAWALIATIGGALFDEEHT